MTMNRWKNLSRNTRGAIIGIALILGVGAILAAISPDDDEPVAAPETTTTITTDAPTTTGATTTTAPATTVSQGDPFETWMLSELATITALADDITTLAPLVEAGELDVAASTSERVSATYRRMYLSAPVTDTLLSDVGNDMLQECAEAYQTAANALTLRNGDALAVASSLIDGCTTAMNDVTALITP